MLSWEALLPAQWPATRLATQVRRRRLGAGGGPTSQSSCAGCCSAGTRTVAVALGLLLATASPAVAVEQGGSYLDDIPLALSSGDARARGNAFAPFKEGGLNSCTSRCVTTCTRGYVVGGAGPRGEVRALTLPRHS